jgi:hypothetical protein
MGVRWVRSWQSSSWFSGDCFNGRRFVIVAVSFVCLRFPCEKE